MPPARCRGWDCARSIGAADDRRFRAREDGHAQERSLLEAIIDDLQPGQVWIADRNFCTAWLLWEIHGNQSFFVIREHAQNVRWTSTGTERSCGRTETGYVFEQPIDIHDVFGNRFPGRIRVLLDQPTRDGDRQLTILSNLPASTTARQIAAGYRQRWTVETAFAVIQKCLEGEISGLGYPRAALFSYAVVLFAFNVLSRWARRCGPFTGKRKSSSRFRPTTWPKRFARCGPA